MTDYRVLVMWLRQKGEASAADAIEALQARVAQAEALRDEAMKAHGEALSRIEDYIRQIDERDSALAAEREAHERAAECARGGVRAGVGVGLVDARRYRDR